MELSSTLTDDTVLAELGRRLARHRLDRGLTQAELAARAGVAKRTVERVESGESAQLVSLVRLLRTLDLLERLDALLPDAAPGPIELLKLRGKTRKRASRRRSPQPSADRPDPGWTWGEDEGA